MATLPRGATFKANERPAMPLPSTRKSNCFISYRMAFGVAQVSNLLYRRLLACEPCVMSRAREFSIACRLEIGDTAGWKPALRAFGWFDLLTSPPHRETVRE